MILDREATERARRALHACKDRIFRLIGYEPTKKQRQFHESNARFKALFGAARFGKSMAAARDVLPDLLIPGQRIWIVGPTYDLARKEYAYIIEDLAQLPGVGKGVVERSFREHGSSGPGGMLPWATELRVKSADRPHSLLGDEVDVLVLAEAAQLKPEVWERYLRARIGPRRGRVVFGTTPRGYNWVYDAFYVPASQGDPEYFAVTATIYDNPYHDPEDVEQARRTLSDAWFREQYLGEFTHFAGTVYADFSRADNVRDLDWEPDLETVAAVDFGYNTAVVLWCQVTSREDGTEELRVLDEWVEHQVTTEAIAQHIAGHRWYQHLVAIYCDPAGESHSPQTGLTDVALLRQSLHRPVRWPRRPEDRGIRSGVDRVRSLIRSADGTRRLFVHPRCRRLIDDLEHYRYPDTGSKLDEPLKDGVHDHTMDALRYLVVCRFSPRHERRRSHDYDPLGVI
jgi:hypothetical protein